MYMPLMFVGTPPFFTGDKHKKAIKTRNPLNPDTQS